MYSEIEMIWGDKTSHVHFLNDEINIFPQWFIFLDERHHCLQYFTTIFIPRTWVHKVNLQTPSLHSWTALCSARYNVGGCSYNTVQGKSIQLSPNIPKWKQIAGFWIDPASNDTKSKASWTWDVDTNQIAALEKCIARGVNNIEFFSNSPMWWMLNNFNPSVQYWRTSFMKTERKKF